MRQVEEPGVSIEIDADAHYAGVAYESETDHGAPRVNRSEADCARSEQTREFVGKEDRACEDGDVADVLNDEVDHRAEGEGIDVRAGTSLGCSHAVIRRAELR